MASVYGNWLKQQREAAGLTQQDLAERALMTRSHISHIEAGRRVPSKDDARRLDRALNTGDVLTNFLPENTAAVADYFESARQLEQQATVIQEFAISFIPGILQTERYARAIIPIGYPPRSAQDCERTIVSRLERGKLLADPVKPVVWAVLDEAVLRRPVGGPEVMAEQLTYIADLVERNRVRAHVMPFALGPHPLMQSMLTLMWFEDQPPVAYTEGLRTGKVHDSPDVVEELQGSYNLALSDALPLRESLDLLRSTAKEFGHHD
ncbi:helix-turn-helix transcriptional regulator [Streptomyces sp. DSM 44915]|uniref:Helix-turn-helix transcriptional regulator n=1 Tax=Streptomyces chisholmiae TaxID=3075540 RepID=A0ABU2JIN1_9ACTN|nr:helix-turn-helix transcriptional regulator [Streptomyces sp. DSM 44915]MDT0264839.1 helix-turn-helix transcriptional regulator [Streptomyces sp. DSM 44915]